MYHSVIISDKNTYDEWGLIPVERPIVNPPPVKTSMVDIPGSSESVDFTDTLTGKIQYGQRSGSWTFYFDPDWVGDGSMSNIQRRLNGTLWIKVYSSLMNYVHGKLHQVVLEDVPDETYSGRLTVSDWSSSGKFSQVTISYYFDPPVWS